MESKYFTGIPFDSEWANIAISVSGGADSALLAYMVCSKATTQTIHIVNHIRMWKTRPWQEYDARIVYEYLVEKFPHIKFELHKNFIAPDIEYGNIGPMLTDEYGQKVSGDIIHQRSFGEYICHRYKIDAYFNGVTRNPSIKIENSMSERDIEPCDENEHKRYMIHMGVVVSHPFRFVDKSWIVKQYKELDIIDLFNLTRSCEGEFNNIDYKTYKPFQPVPTCGECFWCKERSWAIDESK